MGRLFTYMVKAAAWDKHYTPADWNTWIQDGADLNSKFYVKGMEKLLMEYAKEPGSPLKYIADKVASQLKEREDAYNAWMNAPNGPSLFSPGYQEYMLERFVEDFEKLELLDPRLPEYQMIADHLADQRAQLAKDQQQLKSTPAQPTTGPTPVESPLLPDGTPEQPTGSSTDASLLDAFKSPRHAAIAARDADLVQPQHRPFNLSDKIVPAEQSASMVYTPEQWDRFLDEFTARFGSPSQSTPSLAGRLAEETAAPETDSGEQPADPAPGQPTGTNPQQPKVQAPAAPEAASFYKHLGFLAAVAPKAAKSGYKKYLAPPVVINKMQENLAAGKSMYDGITASTPGMTAGQRQALTARGFVGNQQQQAAALAAAQENAAKNGIKLPNSEHDAYTGAGLRMVGHSADGRTRTYVGKSGRGRITVGDDARSGYHYRGNGNVDRNVQSNYTDLRQPNTQRPVTPPEIKPTATSKTPRG